MLFKIDSTIFSHYFWYTYLVIASAMPVDLSHEEEAAATRRQRIRIFIANIAFNVVARLYVGKVTSVLNRNSSCLIVAGHYTYTGLWAIVRESYSHMMLGQCDDYCEVET